MVVSKNNSIIDR